MSRTRILVVDDEAHVARALTYVFEREGFEVRCAHDGRSALEEALEFVPHVILLDSTMPVLDGLGTLRRIRAEPALGQTAVILLTAQTNARDIVAGLELGAVD